MTDIGAELSAIKIVTKLIGKSERIHLNKTNPILDLSTPKKKFKKIQKKS